MKQLLATKSMDSFVAAPGENQLRRALDAKQLTALGIGAVIGAGIFVMTGQAAANHAGPAIMLAFVLAGTACALAGLCYAELASMIPVAGSAYSYAYATMGEFMAWFIGWNLVLEYLFSASAVAVGWSGYFQSLLDNLGALLGISLHFPEALAQAPFKYEDGKVLATGALFNLPAALIVAALTWLCYIGIRQSSWVNATMVLIKVFVILLVVGVGIAYIDPANWQPFIPAAEGPEKYGWDGVVRAAAIIFFAYIGFDAVSTAAQEAKQPQRDVPIGILASLVICTVLYMAMAAVLTGMEHYTRLGTEEPVVTALLKYPELRWLRWIVEIGAIAGLSSVILVMMVGQPRIFYAMANDGLLPRVFAKVHPRYRTPHLNTLITGFVAAALAALFPLDVLGDLVSMGTILAFMAVCAGVLVLRYTRPDLPRPFRVRGVWLMSVGGFAACLYLLYYMGWYNWALLAGWTAVGTAIYFIYGFWNSRLRAR
jgi:APA family basic amino acid/polyamine antiporter